MEVGYLRCEAVAVAVVVAVVVVMADVKERLWRQMQQHLTLPYAAHKPQGDGLLLCVLHVGEAVMGSLLSVSCAEMEAVRRRTMEHLPLRHLPLCLHDGGDVARVLPFYPALQTLHPMPDAA